MVGKAGHAQVVVQRLAARMQARIGPPVRQPFIDMAKLPAGALSSHSRLILTYAMCSFANCGSVGILLAGLGALCPERRAEITALGGRALVAGVMASLMTGTVVGILSSLP